MVTQFGFVVVDVLLFVDVAAAFRSVAPKFVDGLVKRSG